MAETDAHRVAELIAAAIPRHPAPANAPASDEIQDVDRWHSCFVIDTTAGAAFERFRIDVHAID